MLEKISQPEATGSYTRDIVDAVPHVKVPDLREFYQLPPDAREVIVQDIKAKKAEGKMSEQDLEERFIHLLRESHHMMNMNPPLKF